MFIRIMLNTHEMEIKIMLILLINKYKTFRTVPGMH